MSLFMACTSMLLLASRTFNSLMTQVMLPILASIWCFCSASFSTSLSPWWELLLIALYGEKVLRFLFIWCIILANMLAMAFFMSTMTSFMFSSPQQLSMAFSFCHFWVISWSMPPRATEVRERTTNSFMLSMLVFRAVAEDYPH